MLQQARHSSNRRETNRALIGTGIADKFGVFHYRIKSQDVPGVTYEVGVRKTTGECFCTCPDFRHRHEAHRPTVFEGDEHLCKHIRAGKIELQRDALGITEPLTLLAVVEHDGSRFRLTYWFGRDQVQMTGAMYLHVADHASDARSRIAKVKSLVAGFLDVRTVDLTGRNIGEVVA